MRNLIHLFIPLLLLSGCGSSKSPTSTTVERRSGRVFQDSAMTAFNGRASMSKDGARIVFASGRSGQQLLYTASMNLGASSTTVNLLNKDGATENAKRLSETNGVLSPNGKKVALTVQVGQKFNLYVADFEDSQAAYKFITPSFLPPKVIFSPDSKLMAFSITNENSEQLRFRQVYIISLDDPSLALPQTITPLGADEEIGFFLPKASAPYQLVSFSQSPSEIFFYNTEYQAASTTPSDEVKKNSIWHTYSGKLELNAVSHFSVSQNKAYFLAPPSEPTKISISGTAQDLTETIFTQSEWQVFDWDNLSFTSLANPKGHKVVALTASQSEDFMVYISREVHRCRNQELTQDLAPNFVQSMVRASNVLAESQWLFPLSTVGDDNKLSWELTDNPCQNLSSDGKKATLAHMVSSVAVNSEATAQTHRLLFELRNEDGSYQLMAVDTVGGVRGQVLELK